MFFMKKRLINEKIKPILEVWKQGILTMTSAAYRVSRLAHRAHQLVTLLMWGWPISMVGLTYWAVEHRLPEIQDKCAPEILPNLSWAGKSLIAAGLLITTAALVYSLRQVQQLLVEYREGRVFEAPAAKQLSWLGKLVLLWWLGSPLLDTLVNLAVWLIGEVPKFEPEYPVDFTFLLFGLLLYVLGSIMREAVRVAEEQRLTI